MIFLPLRGRGIEKENIMKKTLIRMLIISCLLAAGSLNSVAQEKKPRPDDAKVPTDGTFKILPPIVPKFVFGKVVKGAPYSATATTETIQTLSDGNQIIRKNESKLYRDSEGRTRGEQTLETIGKWTAGGEAQQNIFINDPVAGVSYSLDPRTHTAYKSVYPQKKLATGAQSETLMINGQKVTTYTINGQTVTQAEFEAFTAAVEKKKRAQAEILEREIKEASNDPVLKKKLEMVRTGKTDADPWKKESLGTQTIEGVNAEGTRATLTIPAGEIGNTLPIEVVDETWYSPELQIMVMTKHRDPRSAETTYRLTNINRGEPDRSLFEVPADYTVAEGKMPPKLPLKPKPTKEEQ
jgi:hypothetical protein